VARERWRRLCALQREILAGKLAAQVGEEHEVLVDAVLPDGRARARLASQAPEVDGEVWLSGAARLRPGDLVRVRLTGTRGVDLLAVAFGDGLTSLRKGTHVDGASFPAAHAPGRSTRRPRSPARANPSPNASK
jgi:hypothetical protein